MKRVVEIPQERPKKRTERPEGDKRDNRPRGLSQFRGHDARIHLAETIRCRERFERREATMRDDSFGRACIEAGVEATPRQARKWNRRQGKAYKTWRALREAGKKP